MRLAHRWPLLVGACLGFVMALLLPRSDGVVRSQTYSYKFMFTVPTGATWGHLSCGYHSVCGSTDGVALDWTDYNDAGPGLERAFSFRAWGHSPLYASATKIGGAWRAVDPTRTCKSVEAHIWRDGESMPRGKLVYLHADPAGPDGWVTDLYVSQWGEKNWGGVGWMATEEKPGCPWTGIHVHEMHGGGGLGGTWDTNSTRRGGHFPHGPTSSVHYVWEVWPFQDNYPDHNDWTRSLEW